MTKITFKITKHTKQTEIFQYVYELFNNLFHYEIAVVKIILIRNFFKLKLLK